MIFYHRNSTPYNVTSSKNYLTAREMVTSKWTNISIEFKSHLPIQTTLCIHPWSHILEDKIMMMLLWCHPLFPTYQSSFPHQSQKLSPSNSSQDRTMIKVESSTFHGDNNLQFEVDHLAHFLKTWKAPPYTLHFGPPLISEQYRTIGSSVGSCKNLNLELGPNSTLSWSWQRELVRVLTSLVCLLIHILLGLYTYYPALPTKLYVTCLVTWYVTQPFWCDLVTPPITWCDILSHTINRKRK